ncbi:aminotransferase class I/II-fold pyridoxal phosphate-dependent enzyme [Flavobacterium sp. TP390]|uniref:Aminotransferase class I/II-fold pyridoxal phosphate-dependent enzyme n=1 Tax=Flavobacterium profundi TaxID=1774945 RepID=A0A6I4IVF5_9FLAO|nr:GntG family PLP-dependent aldolase [Flavobacterium profundi]MVO10866.1 aminotransferase class I/II-fold pyridoxal phosphate-dependent enzyme [Flavobacterium profundi]
MEINLISDTVTKPTQGMLEAMFQAEVGDDVFKQDPTVNELERYTAQLFGKEAALFFPSGTMANQTAIRLHTRPADEVICDKWSHIFLYEGGGVAANSGVSCHLVDGNRGKITADQVRQVINDPEFYHAPTTQLVSIENTTNKGGGACYELDELQKIRQVCKEHGLKYHLDGARLWNALVAKNQKPTDFGQLFDTISVCLSKGLGAPVGSVLVGSSEDIKKAIRIRKLFGGNMRQAGYLAAAGLYAMENNISRLAQDHQRARELGQVLASKSWIKEVAPVETNIVIFTLQSKVDEKVFLEMLKQKSILISSMGQGKLRMVTHMDYRGVMHDFVIDVLSRMEF